MCWPVVGLNLKLVRGFTSNFSLFRARLCWGGGGSVAFEAFYMYLVYTPDGVILVSIYCVTCLNLLFSNRRVQIYI